MFFASCRDLLYSLTLDDLAGSKSEHKGVTAVFVFVFLRKASEHEKERSYREKKGGGNFFLSLSLSPVERRVELGPVREGSRVVHRDLISELRLDRTVLGAGLREAFFVLVLRFWGRVSARKKKKESGVHRKMKHVPRRFCPCFCGFPVLISIGTLRGLRS